MRYLGEQKCHHGVNKSTVLNIVAQSLVKLFKFPLLIFQTLNSIREIFRKNQMKIKRYKKQGK